MDDFNRKGLEDRLTRQSYEVIADELRSLSSSALLNLLDSQSLKIGDTAADYLASRKEVPLVIEAVLNDRIRTGLGRVRALNILNCFGVAFPEAIDAYVHGLNDRSNDVVDNALFGIVFMRRRDLLPMLREHVMSASADKRRQQSFLEAIDALEANNPSQFAPGFHDAGNVWRLNNSR